MGDQQLAELDRKFARVFELSKQELLHTVADENVALQTGCAYLPGELELPNLASLPDIQETRIETFIVSTDRSVSTTGSDTELIEAWEPTVAEFVDRVFTAFAEHDIAIEGDSYLTASVTPIPEVLGTPHFDDQQFDPDDGVGLVAIVADLDGSRVATEPVAHLRAQSGLPLLVDDAIFERFSNGESTRQHTAANRIIVFPQFAQLHSGPPLAESGSDGVRCMLVFRARTTPKAAR